MCSISWFYHIQFTKNHHLQFHSNPDETFISVNANANISCIYFQPIMTNFAWARAITPRTLIQDPSYIRIRNVTSWIFRWGEKKTKHHQQLDDKNKYNLMKLQKYHTQKIISFFPLYLFTIITIYEYWWPISLIKFCQMNIYIIEQIFIIKQRLYLFGVRIQMPCRALPSLKNAFPKRFVVVVAADSICEYNEKRSFLVLKQTFPFFLIKHKKKLTDTHHHLHTCAIWYIYYYYDF